MKGRLGKGRAGVEKFSTLEAAEIRKRAGSRGKRGS